jgi:FkbM family methyltransferase
MLTDAMIRTRKAYYRVRGYFTGSLADEQFRFDPYHSKFWRRATLGTWEPETLQVLADHLDKERDYLDIGAWIGPTVLYGARKARKVIAFEPDPTAFRYLAWNLELNGIANVSAFPVALSQGFGVARMASFGGEAGDSMTSLLNDAAHGTDVLTIGWDDFVAATDLSKVSLVKMDIEGAEFEVLPHLIPWLKEHRPALLLSTHAPYLEDGVRQNRMAKLADSLSFYESCRDDKGVTGFEAMTGSRALTQFPTFLLCG